MNFKTRLQRIEDSLNEKQKFFAWLTEAKLVGGFLDYLTQQLHGPMMAEAWRADFDADFLWHLVKDVNLSVLNRIEPGGELRYFIKQALFGLTLQIFQPQTDQRLLEIGGKAYGRFTYHFEEAFVLCEIVRELSDTYLDGQDILFSDARAALDAETGEMRIFAETFKPLADWLSVEPVKAADVTPEHPKVAEGVARFVNYSSANAWCDRRNRREFVGALLRFCPELEEPIPAKLVGHS